MSTQIAGRLFRKIFVSYFLVTVAVTCVQLVAEYRHTEQRLYRDVSAMQHTFGPGIADAMWRFQDEVLGGILNGVAALPIVAGVKVEDEHDNVVRAVGTVMDEAERQVTLDPLGSASRQGTPAWSSHLFSQRFPVVYTDETGRARPIGHWTVYTDRRVVIEQVEYGFFLILVNSVIKTTALWFIFLFVLRRWLGKPLTQLTQFVRGWRISGPNTPRFVLQDAGRHELHLLAESINEMLERLQQERASLEALNETLEQRVADRTQELQALNEQLVALSATDGLTGIANRRRFDEVLATEWQRCTRTEQSLGLAMIDIDWFKSYNDHYGHQAGDACLRVVARVLADNLRRSGELAARYGGEEFALVVPVTRLADLLSLGERIRADLLSLSLPHADSALGCVTVSIGVAVVVPSQGLGSEALVLAADQALYQAKQQGRNQVVAWGVATPAHTDALNAYKRELP